MAKTTDDELKALKAELEALKEKFGEESKKRTEAEKTAKDLSAGALYLGNSDDGFPTGKTLTVTKCKNPAERDSKKHQFHDLEIPTFMYTINLPSGAGGSLATNGVHYYHGQTYEIDADVLADLKSRVARCWDHEKSIHGDNENAYRKQSTKTLSRANPRGL